MNEPTRGVDIGAKAAIYQLLAGLAESGVAIIVISSEPEELIGLSHRVFILRNGLLSAELVDAEITETRILTAALAAIPAPLEATSDSL